MKAETTSSIVLHRTRAKNPVLYPIEVHRFTIRASEVPADKRLMAGHCRKNCPSYGKNGACPPFSPDFHKLAREYHYATVVYIKLLASNYPVRIVHGQRRASWKYTESFLPAFLRRQVLALAHQLGGLPLTAGHCTGCRHCSCKSGEKICQKPHARAFSLGGCGVKVAELMEQFSDSPLEWWDTSNKDYVPPYQLRVGMVLHN